MTVPSGCIENYWLNVKYFCYAFRRSWLGFFFFYIFLHDDTKYTLYPKQGLDINKKKTDIWAVPD
jgi:hypothetical protein